MPGGGAVTAEGISISRSAAGAVTCAVAAERSVTEVAFAGFFVVILSIRMLKNCQHI